MTGEETQKHWIPAYAGMTGRGETLYMAIALQAAIRQAPFKKGG
jgi:hypothetical protein